MAKPRLTFLALLILFSGCNIFQTRTPEPPQQGRSDFLPPTSPDIVVQNLQNAISDRNVINYIACFSDPTSGGQSFSFMPSPRAASQYRAIFQNWDISSEQSYFNNLISQSSTSSSSALVLSSIQLVPYTDSAYYSANYTLLWPNKVASNLQQVQGNLQFYLGVNPNGSWSIYRWVDSGTSDTVKTWSDLKAQFSTQ
jgi:hypothetical protein